MGPTYLVLEMGADHLPPIATAIVLYRGDDKIAAQSAYDEGIRMERERTSFPHIPKATVYLVTVRAEARLS